jgi:hypothetical protein
MAGQGQRPDALVGLAMLVVCARRFAAVRCRGLGWFP